MTASEAQLRERLRDVEDPALGGDIVSLGLVEDIRVTDEGVAEITLAFNAPYAPGEMRMGDRIREVVSDIGLETSLSVSLSWQDPDSPLPKVRNVVAVASGKGGVGKSTVATNLAVRLAEMGARVGLLDGDIYGPNVPKLLGVEAEPGLTDEGTLVPPEAYGVSVISMAFLSPEETDPAMLRGPMIDKILTQLVGDVEWGSLDYLLVDLPPGTGDAQLTLLQTVPVTGAVVVTTPENVALEDVRKGMRMFADHGTPILGVVENMSGFRCPSCGDDHELFGSGGGRQLADEYDTALLGKVPMIPEIRARNDADGPPPAFGDAPAANVFRTLAEQVTDRVGAINRAAVAGVDPDHPEPPREASSKTYLDGSAAVESAGTADEATAAEPAAPEIDEPEPEENEDTGKEADEDAKHEADEDGSSSGVTGGLDISDGGT